MVRRRILVGCAAALTALVAVPAAGAATYPQDYAAPGQAWNVLAPGEGGSNPPGPQLLQPDPALRRADPAVRHRSPTRRSRLLQEERLRPRRRDALEHLQPPGHPGVVIERDSKGVAHITGDDPRRQHVRRRLRQHPGPRPADGAAARPVASGGDRRTRHRPVPDPRAPAARSPRPRRPRPILAAQVPLLQSLGPDGQQIIDDIDAYVAGINDARTLGGVPTPAVDAQRRDRDRLAARRAVRPRRRRRGPPRAVPVRRCTDRLGRHRGRDVFDDLREQNDTEAPVTIDRRFRLGGDGEGTSGNAIIDAGSLDTSGARGRRDAAGRPGAVEQRAPDRQRAARRPATRCSSPARRSATATRACCSSTTSTAPGIDARGASFPGSGPYVELGRGPDYSWSATSSGHRHHRPVRRDALRQRHALPVRRPLPRHDDVRRRHARAGAGPPAGPVAFKETVHGPVIGYATERRQARRRSRPSARRADARWSARSGSRTSTRTSTRAQQLHRRGVEDRAVVQLVLRATRTTSRCSPAAACPIRDRRRRTSACRPTAAASTSGAAS